MLSGLNHLTLAVTEPLRPVLPNAGHILTPA